MRCRLAGFLVLASLIAPEGLPGLQEADAAAVAVTAEQEEHDRRIEQELAALYGRIPGLSTVGVRVEAGVVFLSGTTLSAEDRALAATLAREKPGVAYLVNGITEETSLRIRLGPMRERVVRKTLEWIAYLPLLVVSALVVLFFAALGRAVARWEAPFRRFTDSPFLGSLLGQLAAGVVALVGILLALELLGATALVGAVLGVAGVAGIAVGFAFRNIAENYLAGIILSLRQPFAPNDHVVVEGEEGRVLRLTSRDTILLTLDGNHVRIPNARVFNSVIINYTRNPLRRFRVELTVGQEEDLVHVQALGLDALREMEEVLKDPPPRASIVEVGDSWVQLRFFAWVDQTRAGLDKVRSEAVRRVKEALDRGGVAMPAPEYGVRLLPGGLAAVHSAEAQGPGISPPPDAPAPVGWAPRQAPPEPAQDLAPDRELDEQLARDREVSREQDILPP